MKITKRLLCVLLALLMVLSFAGCGGNNNDNSNQDQEILAQRRDQAESYMRHMATLLWRAEEDITYSNSTKSVDPSVETKDIVQIKAGRLYRGLPYSHAAGDANSFLEYAGEPNDQGIYTISGLTWQPLNGGNTVARVGNDCAAAVNAAWGSLGNSLVKCSTTRLMTEKYGYLRVGEYMCDLNEHGYSFPVCEANGTDVMFKAYAQLQKADAVVRRNEANNNGHSMMIVTVNVERNTDNSINGTRSYVTVLEQTSGKIEQQHCTYDKTLGEDVYTTYLIDKKYSFIDLYGQGYMPITCKELVDPSPIEDATVTDSITEPNLQNLFEGTLTTTRFLSAVTITITDSEGKEVQKCASSPTNRDGCYAFEMKTFVEDRPEVLRGALNTEELAAGTYHCKVECRLVSGDILTAREFDFTV